MPRYLSADYIFPVTAAPEKGGVLAVETDGTITGLFTAEEISKKGISGVEFYPGALVPGFINAHCHLELSHMKGMVPEGTGLIPFIRAIVGLRGASDAEIISAAKKADAEMYGNGIVAVGDISNRGITASVKQSSPVFYHTFLEVIGFHSEPSSGVMVKILEVQKEFAGQSTSIAPHAPYSVSNELFAKIGDLSRSKKNLISIHNQETADENAFFQTRTGGFLEFFKMIGIELESAEPENTNALRFHLPKHAKNEQLLLVHNTFTTKDDVAFAKAEHPGIYWCFCPNANLYIEGRLPDVRMFMEEEVRICLGTDSIASNHQLNILDEMLVLQQKKNIELNTLLQWATVNGASFLGIGNTFGSFDTGKRPGINLISVDDDLKIKNNSVRRIL